MNEKVVEVIQWSSYLSCLIPLAFYLYGFRRFPIQNHLIGAVIILSATIDTISLFANFPFIHNLYEILQFLLLNWFYYVLVYNKKSEFIALVSIGSFLAVLIYSFLQKTSFNFYFFNVWGIGAIVMVVHALVYVVNIPRMLIQRYFDNNLLSNLMFNASIFIYFFVSLVAFFLIDAASKSQTTDSLRGVWSIHNAFNIMKNIGFAVAFYQTGKRQVYMTFEQLEKLARALENENNGRDNN
jgi:hypothetical protein